MGRRHHLFRILCLLALCLGTGPTAPQTAKAPSSEDRLQDLENRLVRDRARENVLGDQVEGYNRDLVSLRARLIVLSEEAADLDADLGRLESGVSTLEAEVIAARRRLGTDRQRIARLVGSLARVSRIPAEALIGRPQAPVDAVRTAILLRALLPALRGRTRDMAGVLVHLLEAKGRLERERAALVQARARLDARHAQVRTMVDQRTALYQQTESQRRAVEQRIAKLSREAADLRDLMARLEAERQAAAEQAEADFLTRRQAQIARLHTHVKIQAQRERHIRRRQTAETERQQRGDRPAESQQRLQPAGAPEAGTVVTRTSPPTAPVDTEATDVALNPRPAASRYGHIRLPAAGTVAVRYGERDRYGQPSRGLHIEARGGTPVVTPFDGDVIFAGPFRGYGQLLIVEHANGYHSLISGLGIIDTAVGRSVATGEPVGAAAGATEEAVTLYFELRRNGKPVDPGAGIASSGRKGQG